jgi:hypothetical protein
MFKTTTLSYVPALPTIVRPADHVGGRFSVWFAEHIIKHNKSGRTAMFIIGTKGKNAYVKGAPAKGTTVAEFFESDSLEERILDWAEENPTAVAAFRAPVATPVVPTPTPTPTPAPVVPAPAEEEEMMTLTITANASRLRTLLNR